MTWITQASSNIATIFGIIIGAVWVGVGVKWGGDIYDMIFKPRFIKFIRHSRRLQRWIKKNNARSK